MRNRKRWIALAMAAALLTGCGQGSTSNQENQGQTSQNQSGGSQGNTEAGGSQNEGTGENQAENSGINHGSGEEHPVEEKPIVNNATSSTIASGIKIKVDYSSYKPNSKKENHYTRRQSTSSAPWVSS